MRDVKQRRRLLQGESSMHSFLWLLFHLTCCLYLSHLNYFCRRIMAHLRDLAKGENTRNFRHLGTQWYLKELYKNYWSTIKPNINHKGLYDQQSDNYKAAVQAENIEKNMWVRISVCFDIFSKFQSNLNLLVLGLWIIGELHISSNKECQKNGRRK